MCENCVGNYGLFPIVLVDMTDDLFTGIDITTVDDHEVKAFVTLVSNYNGVSGFGCLANRKELYFEIHKRVRGPTTYVPSLVELRFPALASPLLPAFGFLLD